MSKSTLQQKAVCWKKKEILKKVDKIVCSNQNQQTICILQSQFHTHTHTPVQIRLQFLAPSVGTHALAPSEKGVLWKWFPVFGTCGMYVCLCVREYRCVLCKRDAVAIVSYFRGARITSRLLRIRVVWYFEFILCHISINNNKNWIFLLIFWLLRKKKTIKLLISRKVFKILSN